MTTNNPEGLRPVIALKPGILVHYDTSIAGGVRRSSRELSAPSVDAAEVSVPSAALDTVKIERRQSDVAVLDPDEWKRAEQIRSACIAKVRKICSITPFGHAWLCPKDRERDLDAALDETETDARAFNATARFSRINVSSFKGYIADNDEKSARSVAQEIAGLLAAMNAGVESRDPTAIRQAIAKAQKISTIIDDQAGERVSAALALARASANEIAKTIRDRGNADLILVTDANKQILDELRKSFTPLDLAPVAPVESAPAPAAALDVAPAVIDGVPETAIAPAPAAPVAALDTVADDSDPEDPAGLGDPDASRAVDADARRLAADSAPGESGPSYDL